MKQRPFRFSVQAFEATSAKEWIDLARQAEDLGYSTLFTTDHYFGPGAISDSPDTGRRRRADRCQHGRCRARRRCAWAVGSLRRLSHPVVLAKELATIDLLSDGRLVAARRRLGGRGVRGPRHRDGPTGRPHRAAGRGGRPAQGPLERRGHRFDGTMSTRTASPEPDAGTVTASADLHRRRGHENPPPRRPNADIVSFNFNNAAGKLGSASVASATRPRRSRKSNGSEPARGPDRRPRIRARGLLRRGPGRSSAAGDAMATRFGVSTEEMLDHPHALIGTVDEICEPAAPARPNSASATSRGPTPPRRVRAGGRATGRAPDRQPASSTPRMPA